MLVENLKQQIFKFIHVLIFHENFIHEKLKKKYESK